MTRLWEALRVKPVMAQALWTLGFPVVESRRSTVTSVSCAEEKEARQLTRCQPSQEVKVGSSISEG